MTTQRQSFFSMNSFGRAIHGELPPARASVASRRARACAVAFSVGLYAAVASPVMAQGTTTVTRTTSYDYDTYGNLARQTIEPDDTTLNYKLVTDYAPNAFGSITSQTLSWQDPTLGAQSRVVETTGYDARSRYPVSVTNAKSQTETRVYDDAYGNLGSLKGPNLLVTAWQYDGWGRKVLESRADGTSTAWSYKKCVDTCTYGAVSVVVTQSLAGTSQTNVPSEAFSDSLGRAVRTRTWGFDGTAILTENVYDASAHLYQTSRPRFATNSAVWSTRQYDAIGRVKQIQTPNASGSGVDTTGLTYSGLATTTTDALNHARTERRNALGTVKSVVDANAQTTSYLYDPWGNLARTTDPKLNQINIAYDRLGRKTQLADPNLGTWIYLVDPLGQTWQQTDAKGQVTTYTFDVLQRMTRRLEADMDSRWDFDTAATGVGKLAEAYTWVNGAKDYRRIYVYDSLSRTSKVTTSLDWDYAAENTYDGYGRLFQQVFRRNPKTGSGGPATGFYSAYNAQGYAYQTFRTNDGVNTLLRQVATIDAEGNVTREALGASGALQTGRGFNVYTGRLQSIASGPANGGSVTPSVQNDSYAYDSVGNVGSRTQLVNSSGTQLSETFGYDNLNRVTSSLVAGQWTETTGYDALGNVTSKTNVGTYAYAPSGAGSLRPNAVTGITGTVAGLTNPAFSYDANGNTVAGLGRAYGWTSFNQPARMDQVVSGSAVQRTALLYTPEHQRVLQTISPMSGGTPGAATNTIYYAGSIEKEIDAVAGTTTIRTYAPSGLGYVEEKISGTAVASSASATRNARLFLTDHLGSPLVIADESSNVLQRMNYDPWGRRRNVDGSDDSWTGLGTLANGQDHSGYTGQEQLDKLGLVNLNGRVYDPIIARVVSADPTIPNAYDPQALNRFSYVLGNPLRFVDPSGFQAQETKLPDVTVSIPTCVGTCAKNISTIAHPMGPIFVIRIRVPLFDLPRSTGGIIRPRAGSLAIFGAGPIIMVATQAIMQAEDDAIEQAKAALASDGSAAAAGASPPPDDDDGKSKSRSQKKQDKIDAILRDKRLPTDGEVSFEPPKKWNPSEPLQRGDQNGFLDKAGREWVKGPSRTAGEDFEWDVQLNDGTGRHINVSLTGKITH